MNPATLQENGRFGEMRLLSEGTTALVYVAVDRFLGRDVVLKVARGTGEELGFEREARLLQGLHSPVFPRWIEWLPGDAQRAARLVLERRPGRSLEEGGRCSPEDLPWVAAQLLQGLCELAGQGLSHGDLSMANVLLDGSRVALIDLGLARRLDDPTTCRSGTVETMAPEVLAEGRTHPRSDLFSLGVLLYRLICGHSPFPEEGEAAVAAMLAGTVRDARAGGDHPLLPQVVACLKRDPDQRPDPLAWLKDLLQGLPLDQVAQLKPHRTISLPVAPEMDRLLEQLRSGASLWIQGPPDCDQDWIADRLRLESSAMGIPPHPLSLDGQGLRELFSRLCAGIDISHFPELASTLNPQDRRKELRPTVLKQMLLLLDREGGWTGQPLLLHVKRPEKLLEVQAADLLRLFQLCSRQHRPVVAICDGPLPGLDGDPAGLQATHLALPCKSGLRRAFAEPAPGWELEETLVARLDQLCGGRPDAMLQALQLNLALGRVSRRGSLLALDDGPLQLQPAFDGDAIRDLESTRHDLLAELCAWSATGPASTWNQCLAAGKAEDLSWLDVRGWLRLREDGVLEPQAEVAELLGVSELKEAHGRLLRRLLALQPPPDDLCLMHLAEAGPAALEPAQSLELLRRAAGLPLPDCKSRIIPLLLPKLKREEQLELQFQLVLALMTLDRSQEALVWQRRLMHAEGASCGNHLLRLIHIHRKLGHSRLVERLLLFLERADPNAITQLRCGALRLDSLLDLGRLDAVREEIDRCVALVRDLPEDLCVNAVHALNSIAVAALRIGQPEEAARLWRRIDRQGREALEVPQQVWLANNLGVIHLQAGRLEQARAELDRAGKLAGRFHMDSYELMARVNLAMVHFKRGNPERAVRELDPALLQAEQLEQHGMILVILNSRGEALSALGQWDEAQADWIEEIRRADECGQPAERIEPLLQLLLLQHDLQEEPEAALVDQFLAAARECGDHQAIMHWTLLCGSRPPSASEEQAEEEDPEHGELLRHLNACDGSEVAAVALRQACDALGDSTEGLRHLLLALEKWPERMDIWRASPLLDEPVVLLHRLRRDLAIGAGLLRRERIADAGIHLGRAAGELAAVVREQSSAWVARLEASPLIAEFLRVALQCRGLLEDS